MEGTTVAAVSTPQGVGGIGVVRISGPDALGIADRVFFSTKGKKLVETPGYTARHGRIMEGNEPIDEGIALVFRAPHSYTGEDVVELSCHGGSYLVRRVLRAVLDAGASPAGAGEFTKRAFLNGKLGLTEAEAVMDLIGAKGKQAARAALAGRDGALHRRLQGIKDGLLHAAAHLCAWADYPEEEIPEVEETALRETIDGALSSLDALLSHYDAGRVLREGLNTVIAGRPNVGKSTLMNLLSGCERSIVTDIPGTTRDVVEETVLLGDILLRLADTAGLRATDDPVESIGVGRAMERVRAADLVLAVFDASSPLDGEDKRLLETLAGLPAVAVVNKTDLPNQIDVSYIQKYVKQIVYTSARSGQGLEALREAVSELAGVNALDPSAGLLMNERQRAAASRAAACLREARQALDAGMTLDAVTVSIEGAVDELLALTGERASEAVVDEVFAHFCVGK